MGDLIIRISDYQWNCLREVSHHTVNFLDPVIQVVVEKKEQVEKRLRQTKFSFNLTDDDGEMNIFAKAAVLITIEPHNFYMILEEFFKEVYGEQFEIKKINLKEELFTLNNRKTLLIIDNGSISEKEIINYFQKLTAIETPEFFNIINVKDDLQDDDESILMSTMKNGNLLILRDANLAKQSFQKFLIKLEDESNVCHENFRCILFSRSNIVLSNIFYENCRIINRNFEKIRSVKDYANDLISNLDWALIDNLVNKRYPFYGRKMFFTMALTHIIIRSMKEFDELVYKIPIVFNKKDFTSVIYFLSNYFKTIPELEEATLFQSLISMAIDSFYANRILSKDELTKVNKIMNRFFDEESFMDERYYFYFKENSPVNLLSFPEEMTYEFIENYFKGISKEDYLSMLDLTDQSKVKRELAIFPIDFFDSFNKLFLLENKFLIEDEGGKADVMQIFKETYDQLKKELPGEIKIESLAAPGMFKLAKSQDYLNLTDYSVKEECDAFNSQVAFLTGELKEIANVIEGKFVYEDGVFKLIDTLGNNKIPSNWVDMFKVTEVEELITRMNARYRMLEKWLTEGKMDVFPIGLLEFPEILVEITKKSIALEKKVPVDEITIEFEATDIIQESPELGVSLFYFEGFKFYNCSFKNGKLVSGFDETEGSRLKYLILKIKTQQEEAETDDMTAKIPVYLDIKIDSEPIGFIEVKVDGTTENSNFIGISAFACK